MIRECFRTNTGILFKTERLKDIGLDLDTLHLHVDEASPRYAHSPHNMLPGSPSPPIESTSTLRSANGTTTVNSGAPEGQLEPQVHVDEESEEVKDALCPTHDMLVYNRWWWIVEFLPVKQPTQRPDSNWKKYYS